MAVRFTKTFDLPEHQLVVQRRLIPIPCTCGRAQCTGVDLAHAVTIATIEPSEEIELIMPLRVKDNERAAAQLLVDRFEEVDAVEALQILKANYYKADSYNDSIMRLNALSDSILTRIATKK